MPLLRKNSKRRTLAVIYILCTIASSTLAQPFCTVHTFSISEGLTTNHITHIAQDDTGLLWLSSINGLWSFDGYQFTPYHDFGTYEWITSQRYISARLTHNGKIYLTSNNRRLYIYDCHENKFHCLAKTMRNKGIDMRVSNIFTLENGHTWLVGVRNESPGLVRIDDNKIIQGKGIEIVSPEPLKAPTYKAFICPDGTEMTYGLIGIYAAGKGQIYKGGVMTMAMRRNAVYFGGEGKNIAVYDLKKKTFSFLPMPEGVTEVTNMADIDKRRIACGTNKGVAVVDIVSRRVSLINVQHPASPSNHITNLFVDSHHRLWAFTDSDGLTVIQPNLKDKQWITAQASSPTLQTTCENTVWLQDLHGTVWTIPRGGTFSYYDENTHTLAPYPIYEQDNRQYAIPEMSRIFIDRQKNLWFTGLHSFNMLSFGKYNFRKVQTELFGNARAMLIDRNGRLWIGNENGSLMVYDANDKLLGYLTSDGQLSNSPTRFSRAIYSLYEDSKGRKWIGTKEDGLYVIDTGGKVKNYRSSSSDARSLSGNRVNAVLEDHNGRIWIATYNGGLNLAEEHGNSLRFVNAKTQLGSQPLKPEYNIRDITQAKDGTILLSTTHGLVCFSPDFKSYKGIKFHYLNAHDTEGTETYYDVIQTLVTKSGRIFMATINGEINEIDPKTLLSEPKTKDVLKESVNEGPVNGIFEDNGGNMWIVRENNLDRYNLQTGKTTTFWPGKVSNFCDFTEARPQMNRRNGKAFIATQDGYMEFVPKTISPISDKPRIVFTNILLNGDKHTTPVLYKKEIELPSDKHSFTINFAALDYSEGRYIRYAYKLEGVDKQWNNTGYDHRVSFNDLASGTYRLLVKSTDSEGQWLDNTTVLIIHATQTWWETWWARCIYLLVFAGIVYFICKYYIIRRRINIEKIISERKTMLYREASHKLRTPLTLIGGPIVEVLKSSNLTQQERNYLETARTSSRNMLDLVDTMLSDNMEGSYFVDDKNAPVFAEETKDAAEKQQKASPETRILVVEDNKDLRKFLVTLLSPTYTVLTAENGKEGLEKAGAEMPDFILSDVTMPVMDGLTMVSLIKKNPDICHIPIIILSARASVEDKAQGISQGIDDYITKPFSAQYLKQRMAEVIANRHNEQQQSLNEISRKEKDSGYKLSSAKIVDTDRLMMTKLMEYLEGNIGNADMRVEDMASAVNLGRTVFFNKLKSIVGMSPNDFLRDLRIKRAMQLITESQMTISEIAIATGFNDQRYFSRVFKKQTGATPSEYRSREQERPNG